MEKRYALVRVDICPKEFEEGEKNSRFCPEDGDCEKCRYGDTKDNLVRKVAQVIFRRKLRLYKKIWGGDMGSFERKNIYEQCLNCAKEIIEFLGVEG